jgi:hypothetical protein
VGGAHGRETGGALEPGMGRRGGSEERGERGERNPTGEQVEQQLVEDGDDGGEKREEKF